MALYDETLSLYVYTSPLTVSSQVLHAAADIGTKLEWDTEGRICAVTHEVAVSLSKRLGITMLSVSEFMALVLREPRVASSEFAEWLSDTLTLTADGNCNNDQGFPIEVPYGRPGWFKVEEIDSRGFPTHISGRNSLEHWKYWSPNPMDIGMKSGAMRSFVTSSGTCSLDLGIPAQARHPMVMIRECYPALRRACKSPIERIWNDYVDVTTKKDNEEIRNFILSQNISTLELGRNENTLLNGKEQERMFDLVGKKRLLLGDFDGLRVISIADLRKTLSGVSRTDTTFVVGHQHPDADSVISSIFEAVRRNSVNCSKTHLPWAESIPPEARHILGQELTEMMIKIPKFEEYHDIILVDCHDIEGVNPSQIKGVLDHHYLVKSFPEHVSVSHESSWSTTIQIYIKMLGCGLDLDAETARILAEATSMEAEPQLMERRPEIDRLALERMKKLVGAPILSYGSLLKFTMAEQDQRRVFYKDYRQTTFGFSVVHCTEYTDFTKIAQENNHARHLPLSVIKEILASFTPPWVTSERITLVFNDNFYDKGFRNAAIAVTKAACEVFHNIGFELNGYRESSDRIVTQTTRPWLMPYLEKIVQEHLKFTFSHRIQRYISAGFYSGSNELYGSGPEQNPKAHLSYQDVKSLLKDSKNTSFMSLKQYWEVYSELSSLNDTHFLAHLCSRQYVELLDTLILSKSIINSVPVHIPIAFPGLILPLDHDPETGMPNTIFDPNNYDDKKMWRYWSPDSEENVATRGHIFVLDRTSIDLKIAPSEKTRRLTFRPIYRDVPDMKWSIRGAGSEFEVVVWPRLFSVFEMEGLSDDDIVVEEA